MIAARWATPQNAPIDLAPHVQAVVASDHPIEMAEISYGAGGGIADQTVERLFGGRLLVVTAKCRLPGEYTLVAVNAKSEGVMLNGPMVKYDGRRFDGMYSLVIDEALPEPEVVHGSRDLTDAVESGVRAIELDPDAVFAFPSHNLPIRRNRRWCVITHACPVPVTIHPTRCSVGNARLWFDLCDFTRRISGSDFWICGSSCTFYAGNLHEESWLHGQEYAWFERSAMHHGVSGFNVCDAAIDCEVSYCSGDQYSRTGLVWRSEAHAIVSAGGRHPDWYQCDPRTVNAIIADSTWTGRPAGAASGTTAGQGFFVNSDVANPTRNVAVIGCVLDQDAHTTGDGAKAVNIVKGAEDVAIVACRIAGGVAIAQNESVRRISWQDNASPTGTPIILR